MDVGLDKGRLVQIERPIEILQDRESLVVSGIRPDHDAVRPHEVVDGGAFAGDDAAQIELLGAAGQRMLEARENVLALRAKVGVSQNTIERAKAERTSERETLSLARAKLIATDDLEAASTYQTLEVQLETIYTVTARLSSLRFTNFMR